MCIICVSTKKEELSGYEFIRNYIEMDMENSDHLNELEEIVKNISEDFRADIIEALEEYIDDEERFWENAR